MRRFTLTISAALAIGLTASSAFAISYEAAVLADNPDGYWRFEETSGIVASDSSGNGRDGTYDSAVVLGAGGAPSTGGNSALFTSGNLSSGVDLPGTWGGNAATTIEAWVNVNSFSTNVFQAVVSSDTTNEYAHFQMFGGSTGGTGPYTNTGFRGVTALDASPTGKWRHIALVAESGNTRVYENGAQVGAANASTYASVLASSTVDIGRGFAGGRNFDGRIDEVAIYETALTQSQLRNHFNAATSGGLLAHYTFDTDASDSSFAANDGTLGGGASITSQSRVGTGALDLRGTNGFVDVVDTILSGRDQYTIGAWVNADSLNGGCCDAIFANDAFPTGAIHFNLNAGLTENAVAGSAPFANSTDTVPLGEWFHMAFTYDTVNDITIPYINGVAQPAVPLTTDALAGIGGSSIGAWDSNGVTVGGYGRFFNGRIDDLQIYGRVLTEAEIRLFAFGVPEPLTFLLTFVGIGVFALRRRSNRT